MNPVTRQDVQVMIDLARVRILERAACKQDLVVLQDALKSITNTEQQLIQFLRQAEVQRMQFIRRAATIETRMTHLENELRTTQGLIMRVLNQQAVQKNQQIVVPVSADLLRSL